MSSKKGDQPPPTETGEPEPPDTASSRSADIKPPTLTDSDSDSGTAVAEVDEPIIVKPGGNS